MLISSRGREVRFRHRLGQARIVLALTLIFGLAVAVGGCAGGEPESTASADVHKLKVALLAPGLTNDGAWNQVAREAVERLEQEGRIDADIREKMSDPATSEPVMREYAAKGYDLIIGHGVELMDPALKLAKEFPNVNFTLHGGPDALQMTTDNIEAWTFDFGQQGYLAGYLAGKVKDIKNIGMVSGPQLPFIVTIHSGFKAGLKDSDPSRTWKEVYTGSFDDVQKAVEATTGLIDQGAQLIFTTGDGLGHGVASAAASHQPKALTMGITGDVGGLTKQVNITSVELDMYPTFKSYVDRVAAGTYGNKGYTSNLENKGLVLTPLIEGVSDPRVPADLQAQADQLAADLASGARKLPSFES